MCLACATGCRAPAPAQPQRTFRAPGEGADFYRTAPPAGAGAQGPRAEAIARALAQAGQDRQRSIEPDPRLAQLAGWILQLQTADRVSAPPYPVIDLFSHHLGLPEPTPHVLLLGQPDGTAMQQAVAAEVTQLMPRQPYTHYGAATQALKSGGGLITALVLSSRQLSLSPVPRRVEPTSAVALQGVLGSGLHDAQLIVTYPDGHIARGRRSTGAGVDFRVQPEQPGEYRVELIADSSEGIKVVANFPVYVGVPPTREVTVAAGGSDALDAAQLGERLLELIQESRTRAQLPPLEREARLDAVALAHSRDMQQHEFVAHTSKATGTAVDRVNRAKIRTPLVLENIGRGYNAEEIHRGLMESPGHRENVLNPDATHVGIGVVTTTEDQQTAYLVTELFARFARPLEPEAARSQLLTAINQTRAKRGLDPLEADANLSALCARAAQRFFRERALSKEQLIEELNQAATSTHPPYRQLMAASALLSSVDEATELGPWLDPDARAIAIGLAQGTRPDTMESAILLVALVGY